MEQMYGRIFHDLKTGEILVFDKKNLPFLTTVEKARSCGFKVPAIIPKPKKNEPLKQKYIEEIITEAFPRIEWISDKKIEGGKSSKRPDMRGEYNGMVFIIEVDESQHRKYGARKEFMRTKTIEKDLEGKVGFIFRFNPDEYFDVEENEIPSSLVVNNGFVYERKDFKSRIRFLISSIKSKFYYKPKSMEEIFLFYDGFSKQNVSESS